MKDVVKVFIDRFGIYGRVYYSLLMFGDFFKVYFNFSVKFNSLVVLKVLIEGVLKFDVGVVLVEVF